MESNRELMSSLRQLPIARLPRVACYTNTRLGHLPESAMMSDATDSPAHPLSERTLYLMAAACGFSAANIYYNQPLLVDFAAYFHATPAQVGWIATAAQVGYGLGLFFFLPLGDRIERRRLVLGLSVACLLLLIGMACAPTLPLVIAAQLLVGITAMSAQIMIPLGVELTPPARRGHTVGIMMGGLLCGIVGARFVGGLIGDHFGWRAMFGLAATIMLALTFALRAGLPHHAPTQHIAYPALMRSLLHLMLTQPRLWPASLASGLTFGCFAVFWTTLSFLMEARFGLGAREAGMFGLLGLIGAGGAPLAGKLTDRHGSALTIWIALALCLAAFVLMGFWVTLPSLVLGVVMMDIGVQSTQVAGQAHVISLLPEARSRLNCIYMVTRFAGAAAGSALGAWAWTRHGWDGVCGVAIAMTVLAMGVHGFAQRSRAEE